MAAPPKSSSVPTRSSAAHAVATARCNNFVREAAPWWIRSGARDASSVLVLHLKDLYDRLQRQDVENSLTSAELARLRDAGAAADAAGTAALKAASQHRLACKAERHRADDVEARLRDAARNVGHADDTADAARAALDASVQFQRRLQRRHDAMREACDRAYESVGESRHSLVVTRLRALAIAASTEAERRDAVERADAAELEAKRLDSVDAVNTALVDEIKQLHLELHKLRTEIAQYKGSTDCMIFKTQGYQSAAPRVTAVSVLTNLYKKHKHLERRSTIDQDHNTKLMSQLRGFSVSPAKSDSAAAAHNFPDDDAVDPPPPKQQQQQQRPKSASSAWSRLRAGLQRATPDTVILQPGPVARPQSAEPAARAPPSVSSSHRPPSRPSSARRFRPVPKSQSYRNKPHVIRPKDTQAEARAKVQNRRLNYHPCLGSSGRSFHTNATSSTKRSS